MGVRVSAETTELIPADSEIYLTTVQNRNKCYANQSPVTETSLPRGWQQRPQRPTASTQSYENKADFFLLKKEVNGMKNRVGSNLPLMEMLSYSDVILLDIRRPELYRTNKNGELGAGPKAPWKSTASNQGSHWGMALSASFKIITSNVRKVLETESKLHAQNLPVEFLPGGLGPIARNI